MQELTEADSARKAAPRPLAYTHIFSDGAWGGNAYGIFDEFGSTVLEDMVSIAIRHMVVNPVPSIPGLAIRMSDGSLILARAKKPPVVEPVILGNNPDLVIVDELAAGFEEEFPF